MELPCLAFDEILCTKMFMVNVFCTRTVCCSFWCHSYVLYKKSSFAAEQYGVPEYLPANALHIRYVYLSIARVS